MAPQNSNAVELIEVAGEWFVRVLESGHEQVTIFETETFAVSYSDGQRLRLGLEQVVRL